MTDFYKIDAGFKSIGKKSLGRKDGYEKVSGRGKYARDISLPGMLYGKWFESPHAHAKIKSMDTEKARAIPGVWLVLRYDDKDKNWPATRLITAGTQAGAFIGVVGDEAHYYGFPVGAAVCAESEEIVDEALKVIGDSIEWEQLPWCVDETAALAAGAPILYPSIKADSNLYINNKGETGSVEQGLKAADKVIEFKYRRAEEAVAGAEGYSVVADPRGGVYDLWLHHQYPEESGNAAAADLKIPLSNIRIRLPYQGGSFGHLSAWRMNQEWCEMAIIMAQRTGRPVKFLYNNSYFNPQTKDAGMWHLQVGFKKNGEITAVNMIDSIRMPFYPLGYTWHSFPWCSKVPNLGWVWRQALLSRGGAYTERHGGDLSTLTNQVFDRVASELGISPLDVARANEGFNGHDMAYVKEHVEAAGAVWQDSLNTCLDIGQKAIGWDQWHAPGTRRLPNGRLHGLGFVWLSEYGENATWQRNFCINLAVKTDGTVLAKTRSNEPGVDRIGCYARIVADELGVTYDKVQLEFTSEEGNFNLYPPGGARGTFMNAPAFMDAARRAKSKILEAAVALPASQPLFKGKKAEELDISDNVVFEKANPDNKKALADCMKSFGNSRSFSVIGYADGETTKNPNPNLTVTPEYPFACKQAHFVEVEVDDDTGSVDITRVVCVNDVGKAINPDALRGQQYGGAYMGLSRMRNEEIIYDPQTGVKMNDNLIDYKWFSGKDVGPIDCNIVESGMGPGPYRVIGIGEDVGAVMQCAVLNAIYNATGVRVDALPATPFNVLKALGKV